MNKNRLILAYIIIVILTAVAVFAIGYAAWSY